MAAHVPNTPAQVVIPGTGATRQFLTDLQVLDRSFWREFIQKYGNQNYTALLEMMGKKVKVDNHQFYHHEPYGKRHSYIGVASVSGTGTNVDPAVITLTAASHYNSGTQSPIRVGEELEIDSSGIFGKITAVDKTTPNAHTATVYPLQSTDIFLPTTSNYLLFKGTVDVGGGSDKFEALQPLTQKIINTVTEIREDYQIQDSGMMEKIEFVYKGVPSYRYYGTEEANKRFLNNVEMKLVFGTQVSTATLTANGTTGTEGLIPQIESGGSDLNYIGSSIDIPDFQNITRQLRFNGASNEIHHLADIYQYQNIMTTLFTKYQNGAVLYASVGGNEDAAVTYGFKSLHIDGFTFHFKVYDLFSPETVYGAPSATAKYRNYGMCLPQGMARDPKTGQTNPSLLVRWMDTEAGGEIAAWDTGGPYSNGGKTSKMELWNHLMTYKGLELFAANQCVLIHK